MPAAVVGQSPEDRERRSERKPVLRRRAEFLAEALSRRSVSKPGDATAFCLYSLIEQAKGNAWARAGALLGVEPAASRWGGKDWHRPICELADRSSAGCCAWPRRAASCAEERISSHGGYGGGGIRYVEALTSLGYEPEPDPDADATTDDRALPTTSRQRLSRHPSQAGAGPALSPIRRAARECQCRYRWRAAASSRPWLQSSRTSFVARWAGRGSRPPGLRARRGQDRGQAAVAARIAARARLLDWPLYLDDDPAAVARTFRAESLRLLVAELGGFLGGPKYGLAA